MESSDSKRSFLRHVFSLEGDSKSELLNICQYAGLALIPIIGLNKLMQRFSPQVDDKKSSIEIALEILIQIIIIFIMLLIIHRIITYVPTYSGMDYPEFSIIQIILITLMFLFSLHTSLAEKAHILMDRISAYWEGRSTTNSKKRRGGGGGGGGNVSQSYPQGGGGGGGGGDGTTPLMPSASAMTGSPTQSVPDYNNWYTKDNNPLVGASSPGSEGFSPLMPAGLGPTLAQGGGGASMGMGGEPMAANGLLGGGAFGSAWG